jgi:hypothetical protein
MTSKITTQNVNSGLMYFGLIISAALWIGSDIFFLVKISKTKNNKDKVQECNVIDGKVLHLEVIIIVMILMMEFVFKYKLSSVIGRFSEKAGNLIIIGITALFVLPTFMSYNVIETEEVRNYSTQMLGNLSMYHYINLFVKVIVVIICLLPITKHGNFAKFFLSSSLNYSTFLEGLATLNQ